MRALVDAMDAATRSRSVSTTITRIVTSAASATALLIVIEDLHWADDSMLARISAVAEAARDYPLLLVLTSRVTGDPIARVPAFSVTRPTSLARRTSPPAFSRMAAVWPDPDARSCAFA